VRYNRPFNELGFTAKCAIVESQQSPSEDVEYRAFIAHAKERKAKHKRERAKILAGVLALRENREG
jgi:hypothetical protein